MRTGNITGAFYNHSCIACMAVAFSKEMLLTGIFNIARLVWLRTGGDEMRAASFLRMLGVLSLLGLCGGPASAQSFPAAQAPQAAPASPTTVETFTPEGTVREV